MVVVINTKCFLIRIKSNIALKNRPRNTDNARLPTGSVEWWRPAITRQGSPGWRLNKHEGRDLIVNSVDQGQRTVVLKPRYVAVPINESNLNTLGINELVSEGKSDFTGSAPYRVTNIQLGLALLDGVLIAPGEEFSFNVHRR
jgi:vancomycin resistance protein YoaR